MRPIVQQTFGALTIAGLMAFGGATWAQETSEATPAEETTETPAEAQETPTEGDGTNTDPATGLSMGTSADAEPQPGQVYIKEVFDAWELRCTKTETGKDPCQLYQLLRDQTDNSVAEINLFNLPGDGQAVAGASIITPLETLLTQQITLSIDGAGARKYPFTVCARIGCISRVGFTAADVNAFRRGNNAQIVIVPAAAPDQKVSLTASLAGFTAGYKAMEDHNNEALGAPEGDGN